MLTLAVDLLVGSENVVTRLCKAWLSKVSLSSLTCPVLIIAGDQDRIVPQDQSRRLFGAAQEPKRFVLIRGANHNDFELLAGGQLLDEVTRFVGDVLSGNSDKPAAGR